ncbi:uncharacterized protein LOC122393554 [Amphibalanus amphitrite]|nr:uncharacterized protein LOC122393554 [Amphibalanus amphitrite]
MSARRSSERRHVDFRFRTEPEVASWRPGGGRPETVPLLTFSPSPNVDPEHSGGGSTGPSSPASLSASSSPQGTPYRPCSSPQGMYTAADLLRGCTDLQFADSANGSPSPDELTLELARAKLRNDPSLLAAANKVVQDVLRKAREEARRRVKQEEDAAQMPFVGAESDRSGSLPCGAAAASSQRRRTAWERRLRAIVCTFFSCFGIRRGSF